MTPGDRQQLAAATQATLAGISLLAAGIAIAVDPGLTLPALPAVVVALGVIAVTPRAARRAAPRVRRWHRNRRRRRHQRRTRANLHIAIEQLERL